MSEPRVVVTGMGWVTSLGHTVDGVWKRLMNSESGMAPITHFKAATFPTSFAAEVKADFDYRTFLNHPATFTSNRIHVIKNRSNRARSSILWIRPETA